MMQIDAEKRFASNVNILNGKRAEWDWLVAELGAVNSNIRRLRSIANPLVQKDRSMEYVMKDLENIRDLSSQLRAKLSSLPANYSDVAHSTAHAFRLISIVSHPEAWVRYLSGQGGLPYKEELLMLEFSSNEEQKRKEEHELFDRTGHRTGHMLTEVDDPFTCNCYREWDMEVDDDDRFGVEDDIIQ